MKYFSLNGLWKVKLNDGSNWCMNIPGTLDENKIGYEDTGENQWNPENNLIPDNKINNSNEPISTRFTRKYTYEGEAEISREVYYSPQKNERVFLEVERARCLRLLIDGNEVEPYQEPSISTPHVFEVTKLLDGRNKITFLSDNSYPGLPYHDIVYSSAATDETQTNWNGLLGYVRLRIEDENFISGISTYFQNKKITVKVEISASKAGNEEISIHSDALCSDVSKEVYLESGINEIIFENLQINENIKFWDEYEGNLYQMRVEMEHYGAKEINFGLRTFSDNGKGRIALNGRTIFLRSEANCAEFPEKGYSPMKVEEWTSILQTYKSYGVNCVRFHSHCPPEAAFIAADQMGIMMQPELSHWNAETAFQSLESFEYYKKELLQILKMLVNHPSFVMLTWGNELCTNDVGLERMDQLLEIAKKEDPTRMYARGSNEHYGLIGCGQKSDFYTAQRYFEYDLRGTFAADRKKPDGLKGYINRKYPDTKTNYNESMKQLRKTFAKPVFSFEVGQFEVLPDFSELKKFHGISDPVNYKIIQEKVKKRGLEKVWDKYVEATGELARIGYREEVEAVLRTEEMSGISLLGLQDFPGQGTALVGMLDSHLETKPFSFSKPEYFREFFTEQLPLVELDKYTYEIGEVIHSEVKVANYGKKEITGRAEISVYGKNVIYNETIENVLCPIGGITSLGKVSIPLTNIFQAEKLQFVVKIGDIINTYPIWVYPKVNPVCPSQIYESRSFDEDVREALNNGKTVFLAPDSSKEMLPNSIQAQFTTDFWSVGTFPTQEGGMGQLIDDKHPLFKNFPTEYHTNWQWWIMASQRAIILPRDMECIITEMDSYAFLRPMAQLIECRCGKGKLLISSMGLHNLQQYPESRALLNEIYKYMISEDFDPKQEMKFDEVQKMVI